MGGARAAFRKRGGGGGGGLGLLPGAPAWKARRAMFTVADTHPQWLLWGIGVLGSGSGTPSARRSETRGKVQGGMHVWNEIRVHV